MNLYSKDFLLDGKIVYYQLKKGYRSGIEPIILASNAKKKHNKIIIIESTQKITGIRMYTGWSFNS